MANPYKHAEAFCHMTYASKDGRETQIIWNSRDGVTPYIVHSRSGKKMQHVDWGRDSRDPNYTPKSGDLIFVDATRELLSNRARQHVDQAWEHPKYPLSDWTKPGEPILVSVKDDGTFEVA